MYEYICLFLYVAYRSLLERKLACYTHYFVALVDLTLDFEGSERAILADEAWVQIESIKYIIFKMN